MIISVASGKGGTGKTTIAVNLALTLSLDQGNNVHFLDCDVEEPNAHLFLKPLIDKRDSVKIPIPKIDYKKCNFCGKCGQACVFNAIAVTKNKVLVFPELCHGCGACTYVCPEKAIIEEGREVGILEEGKSGSISFLGGRLNIGEVMAPPIINVIKKKGIKRYKTRVDADKEIERQHILLIDAPPGTSCPVIESIKDSDYTVLVTEPTPFGLHDLVLAVEVLEKLQIPHGVVLNKCDIGDHKVEEYCKKNNIPILLSLPLDKEIAIAYSKGKPLIDLNSAYKQKFVELFQNIDKELKIIYDRS
ncbi:MAG: ATP-binding protein [Atribacterota bacterium]|nr:ATP-binding protein [Atribacterota bacterium]